MLVARIKYQYRFKKQEHLSYRQVNQNTLERKESDMLVMTFNDFFKLVTILHRHNSIASYKILKLRSQNNNKFAIKLKGY